MPSPLRLLLAALLVLAPGLTRAAAPLGLPPETRVEISADRLVSDPEGRAEATGNVQIHANSLHAAADHATYDPDTGRLVATGDVTLTSGTIVVRANRVVLELETSDGLLEGAALFEKVEPLPLEEAAAIPTVEGLAAVGRNELEVRADRVALEPGGDIVAFDPTVTTCDCGDSPPSWTMGASKAVIVPGVSLRLFWPVVRVRDVPVAAFPYLSLPLENRKTGFLPPSVSPWGRLGFSWEQPFYLVLGESYDATLTAGYFTGKRETPDQEATFRGPRQSAEFRYAPRAGTYGRVQLVHAYDFSPDDSGWRRAPLPNNRWNLAVRHQDDWGFGFSDSVDLGLVSDRQYIYDFTDSTIERSAETLRSTAWAAHRAGESLLVLDAVYVQDLRPTFDYLHPVRSGGWDTPELFGEGARRPFQRMPGLALDLVEVPIGPVRADLRAGLARFDPWAGVPFGDEGADGLGPGDLGYPGADAGEDDRRFEPGETSATTRLSLRPTVSAPLVLPPWLAVTPYAGWRFNLYENAVGADGRTSWALLGAQASSDVSRTFGAGKRPWRHTVGPRLEVRRLVPGEDVRPPPQPYDFADVGPARPETQGRVALWQRLAAPGRVALELEVGEDLLVAPEVERVEDYASSTLSAGPFSGSLRIGLEPRTFDTEEVALRLAYDLRRFGASTEYRKIGAGGSPRLLAGADDLVGTAAPLPWLPAVERFDVGVRVVPVEGLTVGYAWRYLWPLESYIDQALSFLYESPCACWKAGFYAAYRYDQAPFREWPQLDGFTLELTGMAAF